MEARHIEELGEKAEKGYATARERIEDVSETFENMSTNARRNAEATWDKFLDVVEDNPVASLGVALLVGATVGALLVAWGKD